jgi:cysteine-rich repeat protein
MRARGFRSLFRCAVAAALASAPLPAAAVAPALPGLTTVSAASPDANIPIPDNGSVVSVLNFPGAGTVVDVDVALDVTHPRPQDLDVSLVSPGGRTVTLSTDNGGDFDDVFAGTLFDDQASGTPSAPNVRNFSFVDLVPTGPLQPEEALGALIGEAAAGPWVLVVVDDQGGSTGFLRSWSLTVSTLGGLTPGTPVVVDGESNVDIEDAAGAQSTALVSGLPPRLHDVDVTVSVSHGNASDLDLFLTAPSGRRIDLVTDVGPGYPDLFEGTTFDDQAGLPVSDAELPEDGQPFARVTPEGALAAFNGEDPNGVWTLTAVDDTEGYGGQIDSWSLAFTFATVCGDGGADAGEACDDGNQTNGDGCDLNCTVTACGNGVVSPGEDCDDGNTVAGDSCPSTCRNGELSCEDCVDNDGNGLVDAADPACEPLEVSLLGASLAEARGKLRLVGAVPLPAELSGTMHVVLGDGNGAAFCGPVGDVGAARGGFVMRGGAGNGTLVVKLSRRRGGTLSVRGRGLDFSALDDPNVRLGLRVGEARFAAGGAFRRRGRRWVFP